MKDKKKLQRIFGQLNYLATISRPDISFSVNKIARRLQDPTVEVFRAAKRILSYVVSTSDLGIGLVKGNPFELTLYTDAAYRDVREDKFKSTGGYLLYSGGVLIDWRTKKLKWVATSSSEAEY